MNSLYIGTLWYSKVTQKTIELHKKRRKDEFWSLIETSNNINFDIELILSYIYSNKYEVLLLDGFSSMILGYCININEFGSIYNYLYANLIRKIIHYKIDIFIIDNIPRKNHRFQLLINKYQNNFIKNFKYDLQNILD